jgi:Zn-dependent metalloprotease
MNRVLPLLCLSLAGGAFGADVRSGQPVAASSPAEADAWARQIEGLAAAGRLTPASSASDADFPGRRHLRYDQRVAGLRVFGAQLVRQVDAGGRTLTVFGRVLGDVAIDTAPSLSAEQATRAAVADMGRGARALDEPELLILPLEDRTLLAWTLLARLDFELSRYFIDAKTGAVALIINELKTAAAVGTGTGVWGDRKKVSADSVGGGFRSDDKLRPPTLTTYDMKFDVGATDDFLSGGPLSSSFIGADSDNTWTDGAVVDAHSYAGWTYDYYFKRHGRQGIDGANLAVRSLVHIIPSGPDGLANAFWYPFTQTMVYGDGDTVFGSFAGALDVVAHELTHGVTQFTWGGYAGREAGALNESFSDIMGTSVEFFFEPAGDGRKHADYWLGEDLTYTFDPPVFATRSMENPSLFCHPGRGCDPDHYSRRYLGPLDGGGVHANAGISNQAFFLLIEGGTNRTSGIQVSGLGAANRERAERIFYRGFTSYLTPSATFADARRATIRAATDLFGATSSELAQTAAAWTAVGVH